MAVFIDTHCHLDAPEFGTEMAAIRDRAAARNVALCVIPAVAAANFATVRELAHAQNDAYALGIHPMCTTEAQDEHLALLDAELAARRDDPRLVAVGEIGLDFSCPAWTPTSRSASFTLSCNSRASTGCR